MGEKGQGRTPGGRVRFQGSADHRWERVGRRGRALRGASWRAGRRLCSSSQTGTAAEFLQGSCVTVPGFRESAGGVQKGPQGWRDQGRLERCCALHSPSLPPPALWSPDLCSHWCVGTFRIPSFRSTSSCLSTAQLLTPFILWVCENVLHLSSPISLMEPNHREGNEFVPSHAVRTGAKSKLIVWLQNRPCSSQEERRAGRGR